MSSKKKLNSGQKFKFEINYVLSLLKLIREGYNTRDELQSEKAVGINKIETFDYWLRIAGLSIKKDEKIELTDFGGTIIDIEHNYDYLASLLLYQLAKGWNNGGHFYFSKLINDILYDYAFSLDNEVSKDNIKNEMLMYQSEIGVKKKTIEKLTVQNIKTLSDSNIGFGKLGMVQEVEEGYEIYSYWPKPLVCAYIIYDRWDKNSVAMKLDEIIKGRYNFGRTFFLDEDTVMGILEDLQQREYIMVETIAGLNQIRINPKLSKQDILEVIVDDA